MRRLYWLCPCQVKGFNPRTPCGVRLNGFRGLKCSTRFQSTHSLRSATLPMSTLFDHMKVSIHALLAECDSQHVSYLRIIQCFNPRTPCGVRQGNKTMSNQINLFQSTHSLRSATKGNKTMSNQIIVSIHALLAECDMNSWHVVLAGFVVSIHALLAECDLYACK